MKIFVSYRPDDCQPQANGLADGLRHRIPGADILMDLQAPFGVDQRQHLADEIAGCDVVLVLIGDDWLDASAGGVARPVDEEADPIRVQVEAALASPRARTIPVLVEGVQMPPQRDLPEGIRGLGRLRTFELRDVHWAADVEQLAAVIREIGGQHGDAPPGDQAHATGWVGRASPSPPPTTGPPGAQSPPLGPPHGSDGPASVNSAPGGIPTAGWVALASSICCCGFASFVPALWGGLNEREDPRRRSLYFRFAAGIFAVIVVAFVLIGLAPSDSEGSPTGALATAGGTVMVIAWLLGVGTAVVVLLQQKSDGSRAKVLPLPGASEELQRRRLRQEYRDLAQRDPSLALSMDVGRPDLRRQYDDGGLVDLNHIPREYLAHSLRITPEEATRVADVRDAYGRFTSLDEAVIAAGLHPDATERLRDFVILL